MLLELTFSERERKRMDGRKYEEGVAKGMRNMIEYYIIILYAVQIG